MTAKRFRPGQRVMVATIGGLREAVVTTGKVSTAGTVHVAMKYAHDTRHTWTCVQCFGRPRPFHVDDITAVRTRRAS